MRGLTIQQPFAEAIRLGDPRELGPLLAKGLENRGWKPPVDFIGQEFAIHAGKANFDEDEAEAVGEMLFGAGKIPEEWAQRYLPLTQGQWFNRLRQGMGRILCLTSVVKVTYKRDELHPAHRRWRTNADYGWVLGPVRSLPRPILCRGQQGLWDIPEGELAELRMQIPGRAA